MFSSTTIASSTTTPISSSSPSSDIWLNVRPRKNIAAMAPSSDTGMAVAMISVERKLRRKNQTTKAASSVPSTRWSSSEATILRIGVESSDETLKVTPAGSCGRMSVSRRRRTSSTSCTVLKLLTFTMPMPTAGSPLKRSTARSSASASSTLPMSRRRIGEPSA